MPQSYLIGVIVEYVPEAASTRDTRRLNSATQVNVQRRQRLKRLLEAEKAELEAGVEGGREGGSESGRTAGSAACLPRPARPCADPFLAPQQRSRASRASAMHHSLICRDNVDAEEPVRWYATKNRNPKLHPFSIVDRQRRIALMFCWEFLRFIFHPTSQSIDTPC